MEKIDLSTPETASTIFVGARWEAVVKLLPDKGVVIITDTNLSEIYGGRFPDFPVLVIEPGEESKKLRVVEKLAKDLLRLGIDRNGFILAVGGGVVCDIAGFLASVFMRGIRCGYISTSLLSQVDASTGGKNGVNLGVVKNVIGVIKQPEFVICDTTMLLTLTNEEYLSGLGELVKTGIIGDPVILDILENNYREIILRRRDILTDLVARSVRFKASVVSQDEKESGLRRILNFGHTFGHAIELKESFKHGIAVAAGLELATRFSLEKGFINFSDYNRITGIMKKYNLLMDYAISPETIRKLILHDKKKSGSDIQFVFIAGIGKPIIKKISVAELAGFYKKIRKSNR